MWLRGLYRKRTRTPTYPPTWSTHFHGKAASSCLRWMSRLLRRSPKVGHSFGPVDNTISRLIFFCRSRLRNHLRRRRPLRRRNVVGFKDVEHVPERSARLRDVYDREAIYQYWPSRFRRSVGMDDRGYSVDVDLLDVRVRRIRRVLLRRRCVHTNFCFRREFA